MGATRRARRSGAQVFRPFLLSYLAVFLLPFLASSMFSSRILSTLREQEIDSRLTRLAAGRDEVERAMSEIESFAIQLALRPRIATVLLLEEPLEGSSIYKVRDAWLDLASASPPRSTVRSFLIHFQESRLLMSQQSVNARLELFDSSCFLYDGLAFLEWGARDEARWRDAVLLPSVTVSLGEQRFRALTYIRTLPLGSMGRGKGQVFVFVDADAILGLFAVTDQDGSFCYAVDGLGHVLTSVPPEVAPEQDIPTRFEGVTGRLARRLDGRSMLFIHASIPSRAVTLVCALPETALTARAARLRRAVMGASAAILALGIGAAVCLAWWNNKAPRDLLARLRAYVGDDAAGEADGSQAVDGAVQRLIAADREVRDTLARQAPLMRQVFFDRLASGGFGSRGDLDSFAALAGVRLEGGSHCALLARVSGCGAGGGRESLDMARLSLAMAAETLRREPDLGAHVHDSGADAIALLVTGPDDAGCAGRGEKVAARSRGICRARLGVGLAIAGGRPVQDPLQLYHSYREARHALCRLNLAPSRDDAVAWYVDLPADGSSFWYPIDVEARLVGLAHAGDLDGISGLLDRVYSENFLVRSLSPEMVRALYGELWGTGIRLQCGHGGSQPALPSPVAPGAGSAPAEVFAALRESYRAYCGLLDRAKRSHNQALIEGILAYIDASFADASLCLRSVADRFGMNEIYLSRFFKEQTGANFHRHLEGLRIRKAVSLLEETELPVDDIARGVGYAAPGTFRKALRRATGLSPREVRLRRRLAGRVPVVDS